ncbi:MAG: carbohydrate-binding protein [Candidatus Nanopelagicales bacterium]|jgi:hypothetical protein|nr:carbohydrate-binding protein [Candidatus Nanopelagicales bacterium]
MGDSSSGGWFKWLVGVVIAVLAAGTGIVALLDYFDGSDDAVEEASVLSPLRIQGENYTESSDGVQTLTEGGVRFLGYVTDGTWTTYSSAGLGSGVVDAIMTRVASDSDGGTMLLKADGDNGPQIGECQVAGTGGWTNWETVRCDVQGRVPDGMSQLYVEFRGVGNPYLVNVDWIDLR